MPARWPVEAPEPNPGQQRVRFEKSLSGELVPTQETEVASPQQTGIRQRVRAGTQQGVEALVNEHRERLRERAQDNHVDISAGQRVKTLATVVLEMIPSPAGYGPGDVITGLEAVFGRTIDGLKLSWIERGIYAVFTAIPFVPARPFVSVYRWLSKTQTSQQ
jgi:hypothetical protein